MNRGWGAGAGAPTQSSVTVGFPATTVLIGSKAAQCGSVASFFPPPPPPCHPFHRFQGSSSPSIARAGTSAAVMTQGGDPCQHFGVPS